MKLNRLVMASLIGISLSTPAWACDPGKGGLFSFFHHSDDPITTVTLITTTMGTRTPTTTAPVAITPAAEANLAVVAVNPAAAPQARPSNTHRKCLSSPKTD